MVSQIIMVVTGTLVLVPRHETCSVPKTSQIFTLQDIMLPLGDIYCWDRHQSDSSAHCSCCHDSNVPRPYYYTNLNVNYGPSRGGRILPTLLDD